MRMIPRPFRQQKDDVELASEFGTYNIQPTANTNNKFPAIAQGLPRRLNIQNKRASKEKQVQ